MRTVDDDGRAFERESFEAPRPCDAAERSGDGLLGDGGVRLDEKLRRHEGERGVLSLVGAVQGERAAHSAYAQKLGAEIHRRKARFALCGANGEILAEHEEIRALFLRLSAQDIERHALRRRHDGHVLLDDARLVTGDAFERAAAAVSMFQGDVRDHGDFWRDYVRRIQETAQADLDDGIVHLLFSEMPKRRRRQHLELRRLFLSFGEHCVRRPPGSGHRRREVLLARLLAVDDEALRVRCEMRRRIQPCPKA